MINSISRHKVIVPLRLCVRPNGNYIEYVHERLMAGETDMRSLLPNHIRIPADWEPEGERMAREIDAAQAS